MKKRINVIRYNPIPPKILFNLFVLIMIGSLLSGCDTIKLFDYFGIKTPTPSSIQITPTYVVSTDIPQEIIATQSASQNKLILWVPPQFDPSDNGEAGQLLKTQLNQFMELNPGIQIDVRVKSLEGNASMHNALEHTLSTAPVAAPSLILLPQNDIQTAAAMNLIQPIPNLDEILADEDWYDYARQMSQVENQGFGIPFAADALILLYRAESINSPPISWGDILAYGEPLLFPVKDPEALVTINLYLSSGGSFYNAQQQLEFDQTILQEIFGFYAIGSSSGIFPSWLTQYDTDQKIWQAFKQNTADLAISWASRYLTELPVDVSASTIPSLSSESVTLVSGWLWALSDPYPERQELSMQLAAYLADPNFLSKWTFQAGLIPVRPTSIESWQNQIIRSLISQITLSAQSKPSNDALEQISPILENATYDMIIKRTTAAEAARTAVESLSTP